MFNPLELLRARIQQNPVAAGGNGAPAVTAPAPAQPPAAVAAMPPSGGGRFNLGTRLSMAMSGERGLFAGAPDPVAEAEIDPATGVPRGLSRRANNQSLMKMGLLLMAAGAPQSDDSRAAILAGVAGAADTSDTLNRFAANRLEMAKLKLAEQSQAQQMAMIGQMDSLMGLSPGDPRAIAQGASPVAGTTAAVAPVTRGGPLPAPSAPGTPATVSGGPASAPSAASGTVPTPQRVIPAASLGNEPPAAPATPRWQPTEQDKLIYGMLRLDPQKAGEFVRDRMTEFADTEIQSEPYLNPNIGIVADVFKNGQKIRTEKIGDMASDVIELPGQNGVREFRTIRADGTVADIEIVRDPVTDAQRRAEHEATIPTAEGATRKKDAQGNWIIEPTPGGKMAREIEAEQKAAQTKAENELATADRLVGKIADMKELVKNQTWYSPVTGIGRILANIPVESDAADYASLASTLGGNIAFDRLAQMRAESPTGGALGNVTEKELQMLQDTLASVSQSNSKERLLQNLEELDTIYRRVMAKAAAYPNAAKYGFNTQTQNAAPAAPTVGAIIDGYKFLGGDPANQASWEKQ